MSQGVNEMTASGIEKAVNGLYAMTTMSVTGVEEIVVFVINMLTSTYLCLITLAVSGSLHSVIGVIEDANNQLKSVVTGLGDDIASIVNNFDDALNSVLKSANTALSVAGVKIPALPDISADVDKIKNLQLPNGLDGKLQQLNKSIPNFEQVQNFTNNAIRIPFELLKTSINNSLGTYHFDRAIFPVPQKEQMTFCSDDDGINAFFNGLGDVMRFAQKTFIIVIAVAAVLVCVPMGYREVRRWRIQQDRARLVGSGAHDPMDVVYIVSRPYTSTFGIKISSKLKSIRRQALVRWIVAYCTTEAALFVLCLGLAGLFTCACQAILLKTLEKEVPALANQVGDFADKVISSLNNASEQWALSTNQVINQKNAEINEDMFGWVNTSVNAINDTLNVFVAETTKVLNATFGGTILYDPITEVFNCLIGLKIVGIQKALTWVEDNAHVNFPLMANDTFSVGAATSIAGDQAADQSFLASPGDAASDKITSAVARVVNKLYDGIITEAIISTFVVLIWVVVLLIGIVRALLLWSGRDKTRGEGGAPNIYDVPEPESMRTQPAISAPMDFRSNNQDRFKSFQDVPLENLHAQPPSEPVPGYSREDPFGDDKTAGYVHPGRSLTGVHGYPGDNKI